MIRAAHCWPQWWAWKRSLREYRNGETGWPWWKQNCRDGDLMMGSGWRVSSGGSDERVGFDGMLSAGTILEIDIIYNGVWRNKDTNLLSVWIGRARF